MTLEELKRRMTALEKSDGGDVTFRLTDGTTTTLRRREALDAMREAIAGVDSPRARAMTMATSASDGSRLHEMARAFLAGPVPRGTLNEQQD